MSETDFEIAIVGAGLAGASTAALMARAGAVRADRIVLLAANLRELDVGPPLGDAPPELRVVAVSRASEQILAAADAWRRLPPARLCAYERMRVWEQGARFDGPGSLCFDAAELGEANLGHIIENSILQRACLDSFRDSGGQLLAGQLVELSVDAQAATMRLADGSRITARLVIGADGAGSAVRRLLSMPARQHSFGQLGIVATLCTERSHENTAWQCFLRGGPLALLPLFDGSCSLVWSLEESRARSLLACDDAQFSAQVEAAADAVLGAMRLRGARHGFPLHRLAAHDFIAPRVALIGDAAHVIHPLAGQGANLGLLDAEALCAAIAAALAGREDPGALRALRRYEQQRRSHTRLMDAATSAFHHGFALAGPVAWLRRRAIERVDRSGALKRFFAREALGVGLFRPRRPTARR
jgi:2-octaprenylphenol hydroxylase